MNAIIIVVLALLTGPTFNADGTYLVDDHVSGVAMCLDTAIHVPECIESILDTDFEGM